MVDYNRHLINGKWCLAKSSTHTVIHDSATEQSIASTSHGDPSEIDAAVNAARAAFLAWSSTPIAKRADYIKAIADNLEKRLSGLTDSITAEVGMPIKLTRKIQVQAPIAAWRATADLVSEALAERTVNHSCITRVAVGVIGAITPWNYPLHQITGKVAAALAAGCVVVLKPSELAPSAAQALGDAAIEAGLPPGVLNIVFGNGATGQALTDHPDVDMVSFTGSTAVGRLIAANAGRALKRVALELGGKSAAIALHDADPATVVRSTVASCLLNSGQTCSAITRLIVPRDQYDAYRSLLKNAVEQLVVGDPREPSTRVGPLVSAEQKKRVLASITAAQRQGHDLITGGVDAQHSREGYFVTPTVFGLVPGSASIAQEEIFGPVLTVLTYLDEDEAVALANGTPYGLAGAVWSASAANAEAIARRLRAGQIDVNGAPFNQIAPFGGFSASGIGREGGEYGIEEFTEIRSIQMPVAPQP